MNHAECSLDLSKVPYIALCFQRASKIDALKHLPRAGMEKEHTVDTADVATGCCLLRLGAANYQQIIVHRQNWHALLSDSTVDIFYMVRDVISTCHIRIDTHQILPVKRVLTRVMM